MTPDLDLGRQGEEIAADFLKAKGFKILHQNWKSQRWGEIDLVALEPPFLVFVEVKSRRSDSFGQPFEAVNYYKIKTLVRAAHNFKMLNPKTPELLRIDVVSVVLSQPPVIEYFQSIYSE